MFVLEITTLLISFFSGSYPAQRIEHHPYVEYIEGNTNLIISVPHDGKVKLPSIPERKEGCKISGVCEFPSPIEDCPRDDVCKVINGADLNAAVIARGVFNKYLEITGDTPHLIVSHLHRSRLDPNRPVSEAAQGNEEAVAAYKAFHGAITFAHKSVGDKPGLHLDFHGYRDVKRQNNTMIGYLFRRDELNTEEYPINTTSIKSLLQRTGISAQEMIFGTSSLGAMFEKSGYKAVPSPRQPKPGTDKYYRGGWITQIHGSRDGGTIDAIQLEFPTEIRTEVSEEKRNIFINKLAQNINIFMNLFYTF